MLKGQVGLVAERINRLHLQSSHIEESKIEKLKRLPIVSLSEKKKPAVQKQCRAAVKCDSDPACSVRHTILLARLQMRKTNGKNFEVNSHSRSLH